MQQQKWLDRMHSGRGFIAALDQSGGSTPKALKLYGIDESAYKNDEEMFALIHAMRSRIMTSPAFNSGNILGAILFESTLDRLVECVPTTDYLWGKGILPFLKVDAGLAAENNGAQMMKPIPGLDALLEKAVKNRVFGTKMRSVIHSADPQGIKAVVAQQFELARKILGCGLVPIIEPEVDIHAPDKAQAEVVLLEELFKGLIDALEPKDKVIFKLTLPSVDNFYHALMENPHTLRVVALSGGYSQAEADEVLRRNTGVIASFSRALAEGLRAEMSDETFNETLGASIKAIAAASST